MGKEGSNLKKRCCSVFSILTSSSFLPPPASHGGEIKTQGEEASGGIVYAKISEEDVLFAAP